MRLRGERRAERWLPRAAGAIETCLSLSRVLDFMLRCSFAVRRVGIVVPVRIPAGVPIEFEEDSCQRPWSSGWNR